LLIYPVRGNHDCYFSDQHAELKLVKKYPMWVFESHYYEAIFNVTSDGKKFSLLQVDSCYLLCETVGKNPKRYFDYLEDESQETYVSKCENKTWAQPGNDMMTWLDESMMKQNEDPNIIWKASGMHHPMFAVDIFDYDSIISDFLPRIKKHNYDVYFNGHEHASYYGTTENQDGKLIDENFRSDPKRGNCTEEHSELFPQEGQEKDSRKLEFKKGDTIH